MWHERVCIAGSCRVWPARPSIHPAVFASFFLAVAIYNRMDFVISKDKQWEGKQAAGLVSRELSRLEDVVAGEGWGQQGSVSGKGSSSRIGT